MSRLAWEATFGGLCWIAAGVIAAACWHAFRREQRRLEQPPSLGVAALLRVIEADDFALWEGELEPQRPVYDVEEDGL